MTDTTPNIASEDPARALRAALNEESARFEVIGQAIATGNLADVTPDALRWYVRRAGTLEQHVMSQQHEAERTAEHRRAALLGYTHRLV